MGLQAVLSLRATAASQSSYPTPRMPGHSSHSVQEGWSRWDDRGCTQDVEQGTRPGVSRTSAPIAELERENRELRRANEIRLRRLRRAGW